MPALLPSILNMRCPACRRGRMFCNKSLLPLNQLLDMPERCEVCGQKMELEVGFYYGTGYVSYGLSIAVLAIIALTFAYTWGFSYSDNSVFWFLGIAVAVLAIMQPWLMRLSRVLYLYMFVKYGQRRESK